MARVLTASGLCYAPHDCALLAPGAAPPTPPEDGQWLMPAKDYASTRYNGLDQITPGPEGAEGATGVLSRSRFLAILGLSMSSLFFLLLVAQWLAILFLHPCQR